MSRRGSLAASDTDRSVRLVQLQMGVGGHVRPGQGAKSRFPAVVICAFGISAQHRPNASCRSDHGSNIIGSIWGHLWPKIASYMPNLDPLGSNFSPPPTYCNLALSRTHVGATSAQVEVHIASTCGHSRPRRTSS